MILLIVIAVIAVVALLAILLFASGYVSARPNEVNDNMIT